MTGQPIVVLGAVLGALAVALGAFGAHGLKDMLDAQRLGWWNTAVLYHLPHAVALVAIGVAERPAYALPAWLIAAGIVIFSGSLYAMAISNVRILGAVTPVGGLFLIAGWALLAWRAL